jgi:putative ABC transport system substrate-binding protein
MRRRAFMTLLGGAAVAWPLAARGQPSSAVKRIGWLSPTEKDHELEALYAAFPQELQKLGWTEGRNVQIDRRWGGGDNDRVRANAQELVAQSPHIVVVVGTQATAILKQFTGTIPIVFVSVADPVASGFVASFARPGGNITGFTSVEYSVAGKWLSILKAIAPGTTRVMVPFNPANSNWRGYLPTIDAGARSLRMDVSPVRVSSAGDIEQAIEAFAREPGGGMIVLPGTNVYRELMVALASRHRLPAVYPYEYWAASGGLVSYGSDIRDLYRRAASYVDRILKGERPGELPVQAPVKFEFVINLKAAKALGLDVPDNLRLLADRVIE